MRSVTIWEVLTNVFPKYMYYNLKASCPILSRPKLYSLQQTMSTPFLPVCPASEAARPPFLLRPLPHHLQFRRTSGPPIL